MVLHTKAIVYLWSKTISSFPTSKEETPVCIFGHNPCSSSPNLTQAAVQQCSKLAENQAAKDASVQMLVLPRGKGWHRDRQNCYFSILKFMKLYPTQLIIMISSNISATLSYLNVLKNWAEVSSIKIKVVDKQDKAKTMFSHLKKSNCSRLAYSPD